MTKMFMGVDPAVPGSETTAYSVVDNHGRLTLMAPPNILYGYCPSCGVVFDVNSTSESPCRCGVKWELWGWSSFGAPVVWAEKKLPAQAYNGVEGD